MLRLARSISAVAASVGQKASIDGHGEFVRFSWALGPEGAAAPIEGSDVVKLQDGRIAEVIGFLDKVRS